MTYLVQLLDPRDQALLEALRSMKMVDLTPVVEPQEPTRVLRTPAQAQRIAELSEAFREVKAHRRGEIQLQTLTEFLKELD